MAKATEGSGPRDWTTADVAKELGVTPRAVSRVCAEHNIGRLVTPRFRLLSEDDVIKVKSLMHVQRGNPAFTKRQDDRKPPAKKATPKRSPKKSPGTSARKRSFE